MGVNERNNRMAKFKPVPRHYVLGKALGFWLNMVRNYRETVRQKQFYLPGTPTNRERIAALAAECEVKKDGHGSRPIGFSAGC